ncbi:MAG: hypothetical protein LBT40_15895 [Deltaproteobacteria bacterium]|jgi:hypothetical protein|nr:hypothetical protein [Deltaproteobacteria bacterium]
MAIGKSGVPTIEEVEAVGRMLHKEATYFTDNDVGYEGSLGAIIANKLDTLNELGARAYDKLINEAKELGFMDEEKED